MAEPPRAEPEVLLDAAEIARRVERLAGEIAQRIDHETAVVCLLTGGLWFAADLTRAVAFDALWIASYGDDKVTAGRVLLRAGLQRPVDGRTVLVVDDVMDSGLSLREAVRLLTDAGAAKVLTCCFARKPWPEPREVVCDFVAWEAPARFLVGYGMDAAGRSRGSPDVLALD
jgi:hypoxanthine phosphoribosyltransferase